MRVTKKQSQAEVTVPVCWLQIVELDLQTALLVLGNELISPEDRITRATMLVNYAKLRVKDEIYKSVKGIKVRGLNE